jgi:hypothetical protein
MKEEPGRTDTPNGQGRTRTWTLWVLAGLAYLAYALMAVIASPTLPVAVGLTLLPALRLLPDGWLMGVGVGAGWFVGALGLDFVYQGVGLVMVSQLLALAADRKEGWGWVMWVVTGFLGGLWWAYREELRPPYGYSPWP